MKRVDPEDILEELEKLLKKKNIIIFKGKIDPGDNITAFCIFPDTVERFVRILEILDIKVIYVDTVIFDKKIINSFISESFSNVDGNFLFDYLLNEYAKYFGLICELQIEFVYKDIVHIFKLSPEWYADFKKVATELMSESGEEY